MARIALLSVSNKHGLIPLAKALQTEHGFQLLSSGGTAKALEEEGLLVTRVADYTGAPEILNGRVKTLHPRIHGGILARRSNDQHLAELKEQKINQIDLVVVNLYPFQETINDPNTSWDNAIENIDIGGPAMVRAAAKNHSDVMILTKPDQYQKCLDALKTNSVTEEYKRELALEAFEHTASYDIAISKWMSQKIESKNSPWLQSLSLKQSLRYGENPHQSASWFSKEAKGWGAAIQLQGKDLSTNNLLDLEAALSTLREFGYGNDRLKESSENAAVVIKHTNPCGVAIGRTTNDALKRALDADRVSAFGSVIAINNSIDANTAKELTSLFIECVVAPNFDDDALEILSKKERIRLLKLSPDALDSNKKEHIRSILGGVLVQDLDETLTDPNSWKQETKISPTIEEKNDLIFAWKLVKHVRSNAIVIASSGQSLGIGAGQMNRIGSAKIALEAAGEKAKGAVLASDGFFPFDDTVRLASKYGISAIIQPGGSIRDIDSIQACDELGIKMLTTGIRHFLH